MLSHCKWPFIAEKSFTCIMTCKATFTFEHRSRHVQRHCVHAEGESARPGRRLRAITIMVCRALAGFVTVFALLFFEIRFATERSQRVPAVDLHQESCLSVLFSCVIVPPPMCQCIIVVNSAFSRRRRNERIEDEHTLRLVVSGFMRRSPCKTENAKNPIGLTRNSRAL